jgi:hypothetical protein
MLEDLDKKSCLIDVDNSLVQIGKRIL